MLILSISLFTRYFAGSDDDFVERPVGDPALVEGRRTPRGKGPSFRSIWHDIHRYVALATFGQ